MTLRAAIMCFFAVTLVVSTYAQKSSVEASQFSSENFYVRLGVNRDASVSEIKAAYRALSRMYHTDLNPNAPPFMASINEAYDTLGNADKRRDYDRLLSSGRSLAGRGFTPDVDPVKQELADIANLKKLHPELSDYLNDVLAKDAALQPPGQTKLLQKFATSFRISDLEKVKLLAREGSPTVLKHLAVNLVSVDGWQAHTDILEQVIAKSSRAARSQIAQRFDAPRWATPEGARFLKNFIDSGGAEDVAVSLKFGDEYWSQTDSGKHLMIDLIQKSETSSALRQYLGGMLSGENSTWGKALSAMPQARGLKGRSLQDFRDVFAKLNCEDMFRKMRR